jgi:hypothetical protein
MELGGDVWHSVRVACREDLAENFLESASEGHISDTGCTAGTSCSHRVGDSKVCKLRNEEALGRRPSRRHQRATGAYPCGTVILLLVRLILKEDHVGGRGAANKGELFAVGRPRKVVQGFRGTWTLDKFGQWRGSGTGNRLLPNIHHAEIFAGIGDAVSARHNRKRARIGPQVKLLGEMAAFDGKIGERRFAARVKN